MSNDDLTLAGGVLTILAAISLVEALVRGKARMGVSSFVQRPVRLAIAVPIYCGLLLLGSILLLAGNWK